MSESPQIYIQNVELNKIPKKIASDEDNWDGVENNNNQMRDEDSVEDNSNTENVQPIVQ